VIRMINNYEVIIDRCLECIMFRHWLLSWVYVNEKNYFYLGLTFLGRSVTITKKRKIRGES